MAIEDQLYQMNQRDMRITPLDIFNYYDVKSVASLVLSSDYIVPNDRVLHLIRFSIFAISNAIGNTQMLRLFVYDKPVNGNAISLIGTKTDDLAPDFTGDRISYSDSVDIFVQAGFMIRSQVDFSNAALNNVATFSLMGVLIPRGNFAS